MSAIKSLLRQILVEQPPSETNVAVSEPTLAAKSEANEGVSGAGELPGTPKKPKYCRRCGKELMTVVVKRRFDAHTGKEDNITEWGCPHTACYSSPICRYGRRPDDDLDFKADDDDELDEA